MKSLLLLIPFIMKLVLSDGTIYDVKIQNREGDSVTLSSFAGKKMLVTEFDASHPDIQQLAFADSLQQTDSNLIVIAVPATDFGTALPQENLNSLYDSMHLQIVITTPAAVSKTSSDAQYPLFKWLTDASQNTHFDVDADAPGKMFVISASGTLYSVLEGGSSPAVLSAVLTQNVDQ